MFDDQPHKGRAMFYLRSIVKMTVVSALICVFLGVAGPAARAAEQRLSLHEAIATALEHNEDIREGFGRVRAAEASVMAARGAYDLNMFSTNRYGRFNSLTESDYRMPSNVTRDYFRSESGLRQRVATGGSVSAYFTYAHEAMLGLAGGRHNLDKNYLTLEFVQSLLRGIGDKEAQAAIKNAMLSVTDSEEGRSLIVAQVTLEVIRAYWVLELARFNLSVAKEIHSMAQEVLRREHVRFAEGISQGVDVDRARMAVEQRDYTVLEFERDVAVAQERLMLLLNSPSFTPETKILPTSQLKTTVDALPDGPKSREKALANRYELKQMAILLKQLDIEYDVKTNKLLPALDVSAGITTSHGNDVLRSSENFKDTDEQGSWYAGLSVAFPLQNREARGERKRTEQLIRIAKDRLHKSRRAIETELRESLHNLVLARNGLPVAKNAYLAALETVSGELKRFEMGGVNNRDLLASHDALGREEMNLHQAIVAYNLALAEYNFSCATLLEKYRIGISPTSASIK